MTFWDYIWAWCVVSFWGFIGSMVLCGIIGGLIFLIRGLKRG